MVTRESGNKIKRMVGDLTFTPMANDMREVG